jgi:hypothetical protein
MQLAATQRSTVLTLIGFMSGRDEIQDCDALFLY